MGDVLGGLRVLDLTTTIAGPHCARLLADVGADVIKVEGPDGDMMRDRPPLRNGASTTYGQLNAGKRSIVLNLKHPEGAAALRRLVRDADILVENYRPGVMRRLGLDYASLRAERPELIYCAISGYGQTGPSSELPAYAPAIHAASGFDLAHLDYQEDRTRPDACGIYVADVLAGTYAFGAIMTAVAVRDRTGQGQMIDVSMLESMLGLLLAEVQKAQFGIPKARPLYAPLAAADGYIMPAVGTERTFHGLARAAGHPEWIVDARFAQYDERRLNWGALLQELEGWSRRRSVRECQAAFDAHGVPCSPYRTVADAMADPQIAHREALAEVRDAAGRGEDTHAVLRGAGYDDAAVDRLIAAGGAG